MEGKAPSPTHIPHALFNSPRYSDVAFHLVAVDAWIFSLKPVLVEKSTHLRTHTILDRDSARKAPSNLHAGDLDEFAELALSHNYSTFFSYLYWIYYDEISFAPSHAFALSAPETASPHDCSTIATFVETGSIDGAPPCDAHALYRLADRYLHNDLRDAAKNFIVESLTPETAAYEAFSSLGRTYTDVQDEIVKYIVKNLDAVRTSAGWTRALELMKDGQLVGGSVVLNKVLEGVVAAQEAK
uniref:FGENESH: predicted gene_15.15 protein n=1 Tax=Rhodotorula toruloides TaxID=5286 RepID=A0A0K3CPH0_RHOTO